MLIRDFYTIDSFTPLELLAAKKTFDWTNPKIFKMLNEKFLPRYNTIVGNWSKFSEVIKVENPEYLRVGDIFEVTRTRESLYIRKIEKDSLYVSREYGYKWEPARAPRQDIYNGDEIMVMGSSLESVQES